MSIPAAPTARPRPGSAVLLSFPRRRAADPYFRSLPPGRGSARSVAGYNRVRRYCPRHYAASAGSEWIPDVECRL